MKKFVIGVLVGASLTAAGSAYADDIIQSIIGKTVEGSFPVKVDGKQLTTQAAVIDGTSYLPVRAVGEALNKDVTFNADLGIELKSKEATTPVADTSQTAPTTTPAATTLPTMTSEEIQNKIDFYKVQIKISKTNIEELGRILTNKPEEKDKTQKLIDDQNSKIADYEAQITALQAQQ